MTKKQEIPNLLKGFDFKKHWLIIGIGLIIIGALGKVLLYLGLFIIIGYAIGWYMKNRKSVDKKINELKDTFKR